MLSDTLIFKISLPFNDVINSVEGIFGKKVIVTRLNGQQKQYQKKSVSYVRSSAQIKLGGYAYAYITINQYKTHSKNGIYHTFIELHGLKQYNTSGNLIPLEIEPQIEELINILQPTLWRIEMPYDILAKFDEIAPYFQHYLKPYDTTYESHLKKSTKATRYQLYCKTSKDDLGINVTRLEMKRDYSRKRTPIVLTSIEELKKIEEELFTRTKEEFEKYLSNVYTPYINPSIQPTQQNQYTLNEVEAINILYEDIESINIIDDEIIIHTCKGAISYRENTLTFPANLLQTVNKLLEKPPTIKKLQENST
jgi:hypothetical protein